MAQLLENAWMGTVLILAVAALRRLLKGRMPAGVWLCLWAVCLIRLFSPVAWNSPLSVYAFPRLLARVFRSSLPTDPSIPSVAPHAAPEATVPMDAANNTAVPDWPYILFVLYLVGAACALAWLAAGYVRGRQAMACAIVLPRSDPRYAGLPRYVRVAEGPVRGAPLTFGVVRPVIALPPGLSGT